jgi:hypothetical protein
MIYVVSAQDFTPTQDYTTSTTITSFNSLYTTEDYGLVECGGRITSYETIKSPQTRYKKYPKNARCVWNIELDDNVAGFKIVNNYFGVEYHSHCAFDQVKVVANGLEENFCGSGNPAPTRQNGEGENKEEGKFNPDLVNVSNDGFPANKLILGGSAVISFHSDGSIADLGFEFQIEKLSRFNIIQLHAQVS